MLDSLPVARDVQEDDGLLWPINVSAAARMAELTPKMLRYYEAQGLLGDIERSDGGYRLYTKKDVETLRFIQRCRTVDFNLDDIAVLLRLWRNDKRKCGDVKRVADKQIALLECRVAEMQFMLEALREVSVACKGDDSAECPILDSLSERAEPPKVSPHRGCCGLTSSLHNV